MKADTSNPSEVSRRLQLWVLTLLLALGTFALYWPAINHEFIHFYDDNLYVTECAHVQQGLSWENVGWALRTFDAGNWHPITWISHMLDFQLYGWNAHGHHFTSVLLNAINTALVFIWLRLMTGSIWRSALVAGLFGCHPVHVESVAWIAERKDMLNGLFGLLSLIFYTRYVQKREPILKTIKKRAVWVAPAGSFLTSPFYWLALLFFVLGLMSKAMLVTWPFVLLLLDYWPLRRWPPLTAEHPSAILDARTLLRRLVIEKIPFFIITAGVSIATFLAQKSGGAMDALTKLPLGARIENALVSYSRYLGKLFWPADLAVFYPHPGHWPMTHVLMAGGLVFGLTVLCLLKWRSQPWWLMGWLWFAGTLVPVIGLVQAGEQSMADRYMYLPSLGIFIAVVWGGYQMTQWWSYARATFTAVAFFVILSCLEVTRQQVGYWEDTETLFRHALRSTGHSHVAQNNLACELFNLGRYDEAVPHFQEAIHFKPDYTIAHINLGNALLKQGRIDEARDQFGEALRVVPDNAQARNNLNIALEAKAEMARLGQQKPEALSPKRNSAQGLKCIGYVLIQRGVIDEAIIHLRLAIRQDPQLAEAHGYLGVALLKKGLNSEALGQLQEAVRLDPINAETHNNLGVVFGNLGRISEAMSQYQEVIRIKPDFFLAHNNLGNALYKIGRRDEAIFQYREAVRLNPDYVEAKENLARALAK